MQTIPFEDLPSTDTPIDATNLNTMQSYIEDAVNSKIGLITLLEANSTAPEQCETGDLYYNTDTTLIYEATGTDTWNTVGDTPSYDYLYLDKTNKVIYYFNGTELDVFGAAVVDDLTSSSTVNPPSIDAVNGAISDVSDAIEQVSDDLSTFSDDCGFVDSTVTTTGSLTANWKVRKWNNGFCEMWGSTTWNVNFNQGYGNSVYTEVNNVPLPITVTGLNGVQINTYQTGHIFFTTAKYYGTDRFSFFIAKPEMTYSNISVGFEFYARGTWK